MTKTEDNQMQVLKTGTCNTFSGKSKLTYQIGSLPDESVHLRIARNTGGGFFSDEWIAFDDIYRVLKKRPKGTPVLSHFLTPLLRGKSVNTSAFILAVLSHLKLVRPLPGRRLKQDCSIPSERPPDAASRHGRDSSVLTPENHRNSDANDHISRQIPVSPSPDDIATTVGRARIRSSMGWRSFNSRG